MDIKHIPKPPAKKTFVKDLKYGDIFRYPNCDIIFMKTRLIENLLPRVFCTAIVSLGDGSFAELSLQEQASEEVILLKMKDNTVYDN